MPGNTIVFGRHARGMPFNNPEMPGRWIVLEFHPPTCGEASLVPALVGGTAASTWQGHGALGLVPRVPSRAAV